MQTVRLFLILSVFLVAACRSDSVAPAADPFGPGVALALAEMRAALVSDVAYDLDLTIPEEPGEEIRGRLAVRFHLSEVDGPLALDFVDSADRLHRVSRDGAVVAAGTAREHVILPPESLTEGSNEFVLEFTAGDDSLNRRDGYLYALFVPDRAREAFPCFDQPDLKARYQLTLDIPAGWQAVSNGVEASRSEEVGRARVTFEATRPISSYLFTFAAGEFQIEEAEVGQRRFRLFHRETDAAKVERNRAAIFELHAAALDWLERYTGIAYPFDKYDFVLMPAFQFGGMEHPGAVFYRDRSLLLGPEPTPSELLGRASLISHETAHMWFGDLVTMRWFNDVWTKEVFASFMAAKIVEPGFPEIDHELRFVLAHHPAAYTVDRSEGTHPIRQPLDNLDDAASLYGAMIYQKAPIVMKQLERLVGEESFRDGLREYLARFGFSNAAWPQLIEILDARSPLNLADWSHRWIEEAGRPRVSVAVRPEAKQWVVELTQTDLQGEDRAWVQQLEVLTLTPEPTLHPVQLERRTQEVVRLDSRPTAVLPDVSGAGYAEFELDADSRRSLLDQAARGEIAAMARAATWLAAWEDVLEGRLEPAAALAGIQAALSTETDPLLLQYLLGRAGALYWRFLTPERQVEVGPDLERRLWDRVASEPGSSTQKSCFRTWRAIVRSEGGVSRLHRIWSGAEQVEGLQLDQPERTALAVALAVRGHPESAQILAAELEAIENPERRRRLEFIRDALSDEPSTRGAWFEQLRDPANRRREPWVLAGLGALHHPLRAAASLELIDPALEMLLEVKETGDIFFPKRWTDAVLGGHSSREAAAVVRRFLDRHPDYPPRLRSKVLQSADLLFRASRVVH